MAKQQQPDRGPSAPDLDALADDLFAAIENDDLSLVYQPKFDLRTDRVVGFEALARWNHRSHGPLSPAGFIAFAERTGLIQSVSAWVMHRAFTQLRNWQARGHDVTIGVNVSPSLLDAPWFVADVRDALLATRAEPSAVIFEVGERSLMTDVERSVAVLADLRTAGPWIAVDDYGTGYSDLAFLRRLPVKELNIDRAIVSGLGVNDIDRSIVQSAVDLAHRLGVVAVAEGVENHAVLQVLRSMGCDHAQGYLLGTPMDAAAATDLLHDGGFSTLSRRDRRQVNLHAERPAATARQR